MVRPILSSGAILCFAFIQSSGAQQANQPLPQRNGLNSIRTSQRVAFQNPNLAAQAPSVYGLHPVNTDGSSTKRELLPPRPPRVSFHNGLLSINADNSTLGDIFSAIHQKTGAAVELPPMGGGDRVAVNLGPAPADDVLAALLNGSRFDYIILNAQQEWPHRHR